MKKFLALVIAILIAITVTTAFAEATKVVLGENARFAGVRNLEELEDFADAPKRAVRSSELGGLGLYGSVLRAKAVVKDAERSFSPVDLDLVKVYDSALLADLEIGESAAEIMAATLVRTEDENFVAHRVVGANAPYYEVAMLEHDDKPVLVVSYDWDTDDLEELCLVAGSKASTGYELPVETPPVENPPEENPPEETPPVENPPVEDPPEENPPEDEPGNEPNPELRA